jgi:hypothetical protein
MEWLARAHRAAGEKGVAARYTFKDGWLSPYPETTGYIIPTLFAYSRFTGNLDYFDMALRLNEWLMALQLPSGGFPGGHLDANQGPVVFNTGQILIGLLETYRRTKDDDALIASRRAAQWLVENQDEDGAWRRFTYKDRFHAYHTRVAWPLVEVGTAIGEERFITAGRANLDFALSLQQENGWFRHNTLDEEGIPFTHTLAYVARGLLEAGLHLGEERYVESADRLARALLRDFETRHGLGGQYDEHWRSHGDFSCLTGNAQTSILWLKLAAAGAKERKGYVEAARRLNRQIMHCQDLDSNHPGVRGGVPGSCPMSGPYIRYGYPNWAAKFLADALMLEIAQARDR